MAVTQQRSGSRYRLPRGAVPTRYDLILAPDLEAARFDGSEEIALAVREPLDELVLNAAELEIDAASLLAPDGTEVEIVRTRLDEEAERLHLVPRRALEPGAWRLRLAFRGSLNDRMRGFYRSTYRDEAGAERVIATTQFESTDARRAFPCFDEPDLKAVFGVTLVVPEDLLAISNEREISREPAGEGRVRIRFADTIPMSTYLAAFVVGPLEATEPVDVDGVPLRVIHVPGKGHLTGFALEIGAFALRFFAGYYGIAYPGSKLDMVALPDFAQGAMENLGCITYREASLLIDPGAATQAELQAVADTVTHEIAHMWFGDLVTMRWWNGIWLNEAFATFMELLCVDAFRPEWDRWALHARSRSVAFEFDGLGSTRPIEYPVRSPEDANGMFDVLTYVKGASVLRMLERYLGAERFREGIRHYLRTHAYGNTETSDLWGALEETSGEPVRTVMDTWIWQGGYPLVSVSAENGEVVLEPRRFRLDGVEDPTRWHVPLLIRHGAGVQEPVEPLLVPPEGARVPHPVGAPVVVNAGGHAFVRVRYEPELRRRLTERLAELLAIERYQLVDDAWAATLAGAETAAAFCELVRAFQGETDLPVWQAVLLGLGWCERALEGTPRERFRAFVGELVRPALERLGWEPREGETDVRRALRGALFGALGVLGADPETIARARELDGAARSGAGVDAALAAAAVQILAVHGGAEELEGFRRAAREARTPQERLRYLFALPEIRDPEAFAVALAIALTDEVRPQDLPQYLARALANRDRGPEAWTLVRDRWEEIMTRVAPSAAIYLAHGLRGLTSPPVVEEVQAFFAEHDIPQAARQLRQVLESQRVHAGFVARAPHELARPSREV